MKTPVFAIVAFAAALAGAAPVESENACIVLPAGNGRVWQAVQSLEEPLTWPWYDGADTARVTLSICCSGAVSVSEVVRAEDAVRGSWTLPLEAAAEERLFDVVLEQFASEVRISVESARLAVLPGVGGGGVTVRSASKMKRSAPDAVYAYDDAWHGPESAVSAASIAWSGADGSSCSKALEGTSGFDVIHLVNRVETQLELAFDGETEWAATVRALNPALMLIVR